MFKVQMVAMPARLADLMQPGMLPTGSPCLPGLFIRQGDLNSHTSLCSGVRYCSLPGGTTEFSPLGEGEQKGVWEPYLFFSLSQAHRA